MLYILCHIYTIPTYCNDLTVNYVVVGGAILYLYGNRTGSANDTSEASEAELASKLAEGSYACLYLIQALSTLVSSSQAASEVAGLANRVTELLLALPAEADADDDDDHQESCNGNWPFGSLHDLCINWCHWFRSSSAMGAMDLEMSNSASSGRRASQINHTSVFLKHARDDNYELLLQRPTSLTSPTDVATCKGFDIEMPAVHNLGRNNVDCSVAQVVISSSTGITNPVNANSDAILTIRHLDVCSGDGDRSKCNDGEIETIQEDSLHEPCIGTNKSFVNWNSKYAGVECCAPDGDSPITSQRVRVLLKDLNLVVTRGMKLLVTGPSGCGKSTLLKYIANEGARVSTATKSGNKREPTMHKHIEVNLRNKEKLVVCPQTPYLFKVFIVFKCSLSRRKHYLSSKHY